MINVNQVFTNVATKYDLMNDLMSAGQHRIWKRIAIGHCNILPHHTVLDLAGGSGDLTLKILQSTNHAYLADLNDAMLATARKKFLDKGITNVHITQANAENLPFATNSFDRIIIGFGLRNVANQDSSLNSMYRVLKPGGKLVILEFSQPTSKPLAKLYDMYSFNIIPQLGALVCNDKASYQYLVDSIRRHPPQDKLLAMLQTAQFEQCKYYNLMGGIVAIHVGYKL